jgi:hypothetical protein
VLRLSTYTLALAETSSLARLVRSLGENGDKRDNEHPARYRGRLIRTILIRESELARFERITFSPES